MFNEFVEDFINKQYKDIKEGVPDWVINTLTKAGCNMSFIIKRETEKSYKSNSD